MKLSRTETLPRPICRFVILAFAATMALPPALPSPRAKELIREACYNEVQQREKRTLWSYVAERRSNNHVFREQVIETVDVPVRHLLVVDGHPPTSVQMKEEIERQQVLLNNPSRRRAIQNQQGNDGETEKITFHPNPAFKPRTYEQRILHALDGIVFVDLHDKRIARLSGSLATGVEFGYGVIGHVQQGGTTEITR